MVRTSNSATVSATKAQQLSLCVLGKFQFRNETIYLNTSPIDIAYDSNNYYGVGGLATIETVGETDEMQVSSIRLTLNGINDDIREYAAKLQYSGGIVTLYTAFLDFNDTVIGTPVVLYKGLMDGMDYDIGGVSNVQLSVTNHIADWNRNRNGRYTDAEQKSIDSTDTGLSHLEDAVQKHQGKIDLVWKYY